MVKNPYMEEKWMHTMKFVVRDCNLDDKPATNRYVCSGLQ